MTTVLFDFHIDWKQLLPLTYTRSISDLRVGIMTLHEKWERYFGEGFVEVQTQDYLQPKYLMAQASDWLVINSTICPNPNLVAALKDLLPGEKLTSDSVFLGARINAEVLNEKILDSLKTKRFDAEFNKISFCWDLFRLAGAEIRQDYELITEGRQSAEITDPHTITYGKDIFLEEGVKIRAAILNAENGPIYLGKDSEVSENAVIRGPFALGEKSIISIGTKIRGDSSIGPFTKAGGEISNSVILGYSSKGHEGFLGNSVLGEWCNLGAGTNNSNLKNNYAEIKMWDFQKDGFYDSGLQFCGLIMGDHSKCSINTMFNTGTTVGVSANIYGEGFPKNYIPSFAWGGSAGFVTYQTRKAFETAKLAMARRDKVLDEKEETILKKVFELSAPHRVWEKQ
ncbi:MAG: GlmU family protein [Cyclobacteriaceae bacterium]|nr:GlmU family protein [Cyclobacteriaceae bacterium HetDA_MAG_MS6]